MSAIPLGLILILNIIGYNSLFCLELSKILTARLTPMHHISYCIGNGRVRVIRG